MTPIQINEEQRQAAESILANAPSAEGLAFFLAERDARIIDGWQIGRIKRLSMELAHFQQEKEACGDDCDRGTWLAGAIHGAQRARSLLRKRA